MRDSPLPWLILSVFGLQGLFAYYALSVDEGCHCAWDVIFGLIWAALVVLLVGLLILWGVLRRRARRG